ncbi:PQQ-binding-like beta-propeller repeat protein [Rhodoblastus acidophilus]|uniref:PQQ-binding-like beta-propeller repeat protein n=1 Tax=Candidatus Rhodoblastus alkanivorans TaxID=2954117 RepID=A0ABS9ZBL1_9HYPH|nr:PQQ-binding-like beta-propeller repeat protein [Candidatus Rhodoblastus alkanivorans]MCI4677782.1 PQQ-binding-like beta-propeller repeat protein [Candidatus Rhodoblastus alkanivorans]MCI4684720.1 PQQ-binding-like beta-propeller repeat protein [Candidatus Rhodoblastus alkanivorans]MDI4642042.1 PQQ-binding-like beta-propeller repeat protein [Rhodoblastus acidophilus]
MNRTKSVLLGTIAVVGVAGAAAIYLKWDEFVPIAAMGINYVRYASAPKGKLTVEMAPGAKPAASPAAGAQPPARGTDDWTSYNKTLTSNRFSPLSGINKANAGQLKPLCTYDTGQYTGFNTGLLEVKGSLLFSTEYDIFSIDANTCQLKWRVHENYTPATPQDVNRGPAFLDGAVFRGTQDGRVLAYDFNTGAKLWETRVADPKKGESTPAAPIAWNGLVFIGNAGGDIKGVKGRMYALDAKTGKIVWEFYLVPRQADDPVRGPEGASPLDLSTWKTPPGSPITGGATWTSYTLDPDKGLLYVPGGNPAPDFAAGMREGSNLYTGSVVVLDARTGAYKSHFKIVPKDWHDWDVSSAPALIKTASGKNVLAVAPKDGHLYGFDLSDAALLYRVPMTKVENADAAFAEGRSVHFCPGSIGGAEWNGPAFDPRNNTIMVGEVEWCTTVTLQSKGQLQGTALGKPWSGEASINPYNMWGKQDPVFDWAGWVTAVDADTGAWRWRAKSNYPVQSGVTPTAGDVVFFGDMGGNFYVLDADTGQKLWGRKIGGAIGGGVITYDTGAGQRVAAATGLTEVLWPTEITTAKVTVLGLP